MVVRVWLVVVAIVSGSRIGHADEKTRAAANDEGSDDGVAPTEGLEEPEEPPNPLAPRIGVGAAGGLLARDGAGTSQGLGMALFLDVGRYGRPVSPVFHAELATWDWADSARVALDATVALEFRGRRIWGQMGAGLGFARSGVSPAFNFRLSHRLVDRVSLHAGATVLAMTLTQPDPGDSYMWVEIGVDVVAR